MNRSNHHFSIFWATGFVSILFFIATSCQQNKKNQNLDFAFSETYNTVDSIHNPEIDSSIYHYILPYKTRLDSFMNVEIGFTNKSISKAKPDGDLNRLSADMVFSTIQSITKNSDYKPDFCLLNYGGLRNPLPKGTITLSHMYQLMPFENEAVILEINPQQMDSLLRYIILSGGQAISGLQIHAIKNQYRSVQVNGKDLNPNRNYFVLTTDYLAEGGDQMDFLTHPIASYKTGIKIRDAMITYVQSETQAGRNIVPDHNSRIIIEEDE